MIPKRLIFIWLGSEIPEYGKFCIKNFRKVNPDFEIIVVHENDIENIQNQDLIECRKLIRSSEYTIYKHMTVRPFARNHFKEELGNIVALSDAFRLYLLNKYGGIYLDLDTFPVKAFDQKILSYENGFAVNHIKSRCDYFFLGFERGCVDKRLVRHKKEFGNGQIFSKLVHRLKYNEEYLQANHSKAERIKKRFMNGELSFGESVFREGLLPEYYIDHFRIGAWQK